MSKLTLEDKFKRVEDVLIGAWRFRTANNNSGWCCTYNINGKYYDTHPHKDLGAALDKVYITAKRIKGKRTA